MKSIETLRLEIDEIDQKIGLLLYERFLTTGKIGEVKKLIKKEVLDQNREAQVFENVLRDLPTDAYNDEIEELYKLLVQLSKKMQSKL